MVNYLHPFAKSNTNKLPSQNTYCSIFKYTKPNSDSDCIPYSDEMSVVLSLI